MVYDSPKAAHFDCLQGGRLLPPNDEVGLHLRWRAAKLIGESVTDNMASKDMLPAVDKFLETWCVSPLWQVRRRVCDQCGGEGVLDSGGFSPQGESINVPCVCIETFDCNAGDHADCCPANLNHFPPFMHSNNKSTERNCAEAAMAQLGLFAELNDFRIRDKVIFALAPWIQAEREAKPEAEKLIEVENEIRSVLLLMDGLAEQWGDEGVFRRCRDRLRALVAE